MRWAKTYKGNGRILSIFRVDKVLLRVNLSEAVIPQSWVQIKLRVSGNIVSSLRHKMRRVGLRVLTITWENREFRLGKSNGSRHSVWEASKNMVCDLRWCNYFLLFSAHSLFSWFGYTLKPFVLQPRQILYYLSECYVNEIRVNWRKAEKIGTFGTRVKQANAFRDWCLQTLKQKKQELEEKLKTNKEILRKTQMELEDKVRNWEGKYCQK